MLVRGAGMFLLLVGVLVAALLASGCGGDDSSSAHATVGIRYSHFTADDITVPAGVPVTITLRNDDPIDHEWIVGDEALHQRHRTGTEPSHGERPTEQTILAGQRVETVVTFDTPGEYSYICHLPRHEAYGMKGRLTVVP